MSLVVYFVFMSVSTGFVYALLNSSRWCVADPDRL